MHSCPYCSAVVKIEPAEHQQEADVGGTDARLKEVNVEERGTQLSQDVFTSRPRRFTSLV